MRADRQKLGSDAAPALRKKPGANAPPTIPTRVVQGMRGRERPGGRAEA
jgi:hypothetical protein